MPEHGQGGVGALAGFLYQLVGTAALAIDASELQPGTDGEVPDGVFKAAVTAEPRAGEDALVALSGGDVHYVQFKHADAIDKGDLREVLGSFSRTLAGLKPDDRRKVKGLWLCTTGRLAEGPAEDVFRVADAFRDLSLSELDWSASLPPEVTLSKKVSGTKTFAEYVKRLATDLTTQGQEFTVQELQPIIPLLQVRADTSLSSYSDTLRREARLHGVLEEELDDGLNTVIGHVLKATQYPFQDLTRDTLLRLIARTGSPPPLLQPSALQLACIDEFKREWTQLLSGGPIGWDDLRNRREVEEVAQLVASLPDAGWVGVSGKGGAGKTAVLLLSVNRICQPPSLGGVHWLPINVRLQDGHSVDDVEVAVRRICGRRDDLPTLLERVQEAASVADETFRLLVVADGADEHEFLQRGEFAHLLNAVRRQKDQVCLLFTARTRATSEIGVLRPALFGYPLWDVVGGSGQDDTLIEVRDFGDPGGTDQPELLQFLTDMGLGDVARELRERTTQSPIGFETVPSQAGPSVAVPLSAYVIGCLKALRDELNAEDWRLLTAALVRGTAEYEALRPLCRKVVDCFRSRAQAHAGIGGDTVLDLLQHYSQQLEFDVEPPNPDGLTVCWQAVDCGIMDESGKRNHFAWVSEAIRRYVESL